MIILGWAHTHKNTKTSFPIYSLTDLWSRATWESLTDTTVPHVSTALKTHRLDKGKYKGNYHESQCHPKTPHLSSFTTSRALNASSIVPGSFGVWRGERGVPLFSYLIKANGNEVCVLEEGEHSCVCECSCVRLQCVFLRWSVRQGCERYRRCIYPFKSVSCWDVLWRDL